MNNFKKTSWYLRRLQRVIPKQPVSLVGDVLWKIEIMSKDKPTWTMRLNGTIIETQHTIEIHEIKPGVWRPDNFFLDSGLPLWIMGSRDVMHLESSGTVYAHTAHVTDALKTEKPDQILKWYIPHYSKVVNTEAIYSTFKPKAPVTRLTWSTYAAETRILFNDELLWILPTALIEISGIEHSNLDEMEPKIEATSTQVPAVTFEPESVETEQETEPEVSLTPPKTSAPVSIVPTTIKPTNKRQLRHVEWDLNVDPEELYSMDKLQAPGLPGLARISVSDAIDLKYKTVKVLELHGQGDEHETLGVVLM